MVVKRTCSFCAREIEPGTGSMFVKRDGTTYTFCSSSCRKQQLHLGRVGHRFKWTRAFELKRAAERSTAARAPAAAASAPKAAAPAAPPAAVAAEASAEPSEAPADVPAAAPKAKAAGTARAKRPKPAEKS